MCVFPNWDAGLVVYTGYFKQPPLHPPNNPRDSGGRQKKLAILADASAKVLTPPPKLLAETSWIYASFFLFLLKYISFWNNKSLKWMILKEKKTLVL